MIPIGNINPGHASRGFRFAQPTAKRGLSPVGEMSCQLSVFSWQRGSLRSLMTLTTLRTLGLAREGAGELPLAPTATRPT